MSNKAYNYRNYLRNRFIGIALFTIVFITLVGNISVKYYFTHFLNAQIDQNNLQIVQSIESLIDSDDLNNQNIRALSFANNVYIKIYDDEMNPLFESLPVGKGQGMGNGRNSLSSIYDPQTLDISTFPLSNSVDQILYQLEIGRTANLNSDSIESNFILTLNIVFLLTLVVTIVLSIFYSFYQSKKITVPLSQLIYNTQLIEHERFKDFNTVDSDFYEIKSLYESLSNLNNKLQHQSALRKRLTTDISHELRNPLSIIRSHIEAFVDGVWEPTEEKLLKCNDEILRLTKLIDQLNELSVVENALVLNLKAHDLVQTVKKVLSSFESLAEDRNMKIKFEHPEHLTLNYDEDRIIQVIVNLISNAIKYSKDYGCLNIHIVNEHHGTELSFVDQGIGISQSDLPYIFERFYRADTSRSKDTGGLGIGLAVSKAICDAHHFDLVASSILNRGSTFTIKF